MVLAAAIVFLAFVLGGLILVAVSGLSLWRTIKRGKATVMAPLGEVMLSSEDAQAAVSRLEARQSQLGDAQGELAAQAAAAAKLGQAATGGVIMVLYPLRFLMGR